MKKEIFLQVGDVVDLKKGMKVYITVPLSKKDKHTTDVELGKILKIGVGKKTLEFETKSYIGRYIVTDTSMSGGGTGHGLHDVYPDGWHVTCVMLNDDGTYCEINRKVTFYQSGCFTAMITPDKIKAIKGIKYQRTFMPTLMTILGKEK